MISAMIICDSISPDGVRITTYELEYPRFIHSELMTHRVFSRNAQSSRAVPVKKSLEQEYVVPTVWGKNQPGMSSTEELTAQPKRECQYYWHALVRYCKDFSGRMADAGLHKQWANRPLEWFSNIKVVVTATEWDNFFWLRDDPDAAQPEIVELARKMKEEMDDSVPTPLAYGDWHLPYVVRVMVRGKVVGYSVEVEPNVLQDVTLEDALKISASCCAQVSYRNLNRKLDKALSIYEKLFDGPKPHMSPIEHQALCSPLVREIGERWPKGVTHMDRNSQLWSGNFRGWVQQRQLMQGNYGE